MMGKPERHRSKRSPFDEAASEYVGPDLPSEVATMVQSQWPMELIAQETGLSHVDINRLASARVSMPFMPTPDQIVERAAEVRRNWTRTTMNQRYAHHPTPWALPNVGDSYDIEPIER